MAGITKKEFEKAILEFSPEQTENLRILHEKLTKLALECRQNKMECLDFIYGLIGFAYQVILDTIGDNEKAHEHITMVFQDFKDTVDNFKFKK